MPVHRGSTQGSQLGRVCVCVCVVQCVSSWVSSTVGHLVVIHLHVICENVTAALLSNSHATMRAAFIQTEL